jgi:type IV pilus assembly protein PilV
MKRLPTALLRTRGFSLVEIMVAVVVICVGLLGIAKMQALAVSNTSMSRQRSLAAIEAASFASSMHSNREYWASFTVPFQVSISGTPPVVAAPSDAALQAQTTADIAAAGGGPCIGNNSGAATCSAAADPQALAAFDLARWWNTVSLLLPNPTLSVSCPGSPVGNPAPISCTVQIFWLEKAVAMNTTEANQEAQAHAPGTAASAAEQPVFILYVEP